MRSAIALIWLSLCWTLLCFLFYRDRELIIQASLPVWVASALAWIVYRILAAALPWGRRRRGAGPKARKKVASRPGSRAVGGRTTRTPARKRSR